MSEDIKKEQESGQEIEGQNPEVTTENNAEGQEEVENQSSETQDSQDADTEAVTEPVAEESTETASENPEEITAEVSEDTDDEPKAEASEEEKEVEEVTEDSKEVEEEAQEEEAAEAEPTAEETSDEPVEAEVSEEPEAKEEEEAETPTEEVVAETTEETSSEDTTPSNTEEEKPAEEGSAPDETVEAEVNQEPQAKEEADTPAEEVVVETTEENSTEDTTPSETEEKPADEDSASEESSDEAQEEKAAEEEEQIDYSNHSREELVAAVEELAQNEKNTGINAVISQIVPRFNELEKGLREAAQNKFLLDGGNADDFQFKPDDLFNRFDASVRLMRDRRARFIKEREANKEKNYEKKLALLDKLRELVDGEEATTNIAPIKAIQQEWREIGAVPNQHNRTLWANYNALLDRFFNHRNILFELRELDRKKNQKLKEELCEKAEALNALEDIKSAIQQLNELHEEYKRVGAVPREVQESLWQRFKAASDEIYKKRKVYLEELKGELNENLVKKRALAEEIKAYISFDSDRINEWNAKTKEVIAIQKKWEALGGLPREHAKEVNKDFWSSFKKFFSRKNEFFKKLEGKRKENLEAKQQLVEEARTIKDNEDWDKTSDKLKGLQRKWKEIGPVPEKFRNSVYADFKAACDEFFNNRRANQSKAEEGYVENLKQKEALCKEIEKKTKKKEGTAEDVDNFVAQWKEIGFVPRNSIKQIEEEFKKVLEGFVAVIDVPEEDREGVIMKAQLSGLSKGPNADRNIQKKEGAIRRQIQELENNINLWNNNLAFFANSKTADKLKVEFDEKIEKAEEELRKLKKQLRLVRSI